MQQDMHFYGTYAVARSAGLAPQVALTVANAAQFVDDAEINYPLELADQTTITPVCTAHAMCDFHNFLASDVKRVWLPFHFLPGLVGQNIEERLICRPGRVGNSSVDALVSFVTSNRKELFGPHLLGIASHIIEDTYSHFGFAGAVTDYNAVVQDSIDTSEIKDTSIAKHVTNKLFRQFDRMKGAAGELARSGHGAVSELPDRPYLKWSFKYQASLASHPRVEGTLTAEHDNTALYLEAAERLYYIYTEWGQNNIHVATPLNARPYSNIKERIRSILSFEGEKMDRCEKWLEAIREGYLFDVQAGEVDELVYDKESWSPVGLAELDSPEETDAYKYIQAARTYRDHMLETVLPGLGLGQALGMS